MKNILIIDDEEKVSGVIKAYLEKEGYKVYCTASGTEGLSFFNSNDIALIILDLMLPDIQGEEICRVIRAKSDVYIFMLTAKSNLEDRIEGFNAGADEYLVKPYNPRELTARVNALFRRVDDEGSDVISFNNGELKIYKYSRMIKLKGKEIVLTRNEFDILYLLATNKGKAFKREQLIKKALGIDFEGLDRTIDVYIKNIRKKIEEDSKNPKYILTLNRIGYKFGGEN